MSDSIGTNPTKYVLTYDILHIEDNLPGQLQYGTFDHAGAVLANGMLYLHGNIGTEDASLDALCPLITDGTVDEQGIIYVPDTAYKKDYVYPLRDNRLLMLGQYEDTETTNNAYSLYMTDGTGVVLAEVSLSDIEYRSQPTVSVCEAEDGTYVVLVYFARSALCCFSINGDSIVREATISADDTDLTLFHEQGLRVERDGTVISISSLVTSYNAKADITYEHHGLRIDPQTGTVKNFYLRMPEKHGFTRVFIGADGNIYLTNGDGIYLYNDNAAPSKIFSWIDAGITGYGLHSDNALWIIDRNTLFINMSRDENGRTVNGLLCVRMSLDEDLADKTEIRLAAYSSINHWLEEQIVAFNAQSESYHVSIIAAKGENNAESAEHFEEMMLYGVHPDMILTGNLDLEKYYDKGVFADLSPHFSDALLGCVLDSKRRGDALYTVPMMMKLRTFVCAENVLDVPLTWEKLYAISEQLTLEEVLFADSLYNDAVAEIREGALMDFYDPDASKSYYNTEAFYDMIQYLETMSGYCDPGYGVLWHTGFQYAVTNTTLGARLRDGGMKFVTVPLNTVEAVMVVKLLYNGTEINWCGYPSRDGGSVSALYKSELSVMADTAVMDGCIDFLEFLLSEEAQSSSLLIYDALPVTRTGMERTLIKCRYWYYRVQDYEKIYDPNAYMIEQFSLSGQKVSYLPFLADGSSCDYIVDYGEEMKTEGNYIVEMLTDEEINAFLSFLDRCQAKTVDAVISSIVEEELSAWIGSARSLEDAAKIIQSRVSIYLSE